jgi:hypothetical protein
MSTYNSSGITTLDWRLADLVDQTAYDQIKQNGGASAVIYGVPVGANYNEFKNTINTYKQSTNQSLSYSQQVNLAWTGLDPNAQSAYTACLQAEQQKTGLHAFVVFATTTNIAIQINWNVPGISTAGIAVAGADAQTQALFPQRVGNGAVTVVVPRPQIEFAIAINSVQPSGYSASLVLEPLPPPPIPVSPPQEYPSVGKWFWIANVSTGWYLNVYGGTFSTIRTPLDVTNTPPHHRFCLNKVGEPNLYEVRTEDLRYVMGRWQGVPWPHDAIVISTAGVAIQYWQLEKVSPGKYRFRVPGSNNYIALGPSANAPSPHYALSEEDLSKAEVWTFEPQGDCSP